MLTGVYCITAPQTHLQSMSSYGTSLPAWRRHQGAARSHVEDGSTFQGNVLLCSHFTARSHDKLTPTQGSMTAACQCTACRACSVLCELCIGGHWSMEEEDVRLWLTFTSILPESIPFRFSMSSCDLHCTVIHFDVTFTSQISIPKSNFPP